jgi:hypothetical protein
MYADFCQVVAMFGGRNVRFRLVLVDDSVNLISGFGSVQPKENDIPASVGLTIGCNGYTIGFRTEEGRGSAHYKLIWEIPNEWNSRLLPRETVSRQQWNLWQGILSRLND